MPQMRRAGKRRPYMSGSDRGRPMTDSLTIARQVLEIEADAVRGLIGGLNENFERAVEMLASCAGRVVVAGMGKCGLIGRKISATLASTGTPSVTVHPADAIHGDLGMITQDDVVLALSNSGETEELIRLLPTIRKIGAKLISITGKADSTLARHSDILLHTFVSREACPYNLAPTASTTAQLALGDALAVALMLRKGFTPEKYALLHPGGALGKQFLKVEDVMRSGPRMVRVAPETTVREVVIALTQTRNGAACIVDADGNLAGVFTDGDFRRAILNDCQAIEQPVSRFMTRNPVAILEGKLAVEAARLMREGSRKISQLPVVDDRGRLLGLLDDDELLNL
jgi:arabinose-5-phosphate isomerase